MTTNIPCERKRAKWCAIVGTLIYLIFCPVMFLWAIILGVSADRSFANTIIAILRFSIPISMIISVWTMWSNYHVYDRYNRVCLLALLPLVLIGIFILIDTILETFFQ